MLKNPLKLSVGSSLVALLVLAACSETTSPPKKTAEAADETELAAGGGAGASGTDDSSEPAATGGQGGSKGDVEEEVVFGLQIPKEVLVHRGEALAFPASVKVAKWKSVTVTLVDAPAGVTLTKGEDELTVAVGPDVPEGDVELTLEVEGEEESVKQTLVLTVPGAPGSYDKTFATEGKLALGGSGCQLLVDDDRRLLALTSSQLTRVLWDGTLDAEYDEDGIAPLSFTPDGEYNHGLKMAMLQNGDVAVTGRKWFTEGEPICIERFDSSGQPMGLDGDGRICVNADQWITPFGDDAMLVYGMEFGGSDGAAVKVNANGKVDTKFGGGDGVASWLTPQTDIASAAFPSSSGFFLAIENYAVTEYSVVRFDAKGEVATGFGTAGQKTFTGHNLFEAAQGPGGRMFFQSRKGSESYVMVLDSQGESDAYFGDEGLIDLTPLGKFVLGAYPSDNLDEIWLYMSEAPNKLARVDAKGTLDTGFGVDGYVAVSASGFGSVISLPRGRVALIDGDGTIHRLWR